MSTSPRRATRRRSPTRKVVFANGLGFEGWINRLVKASGTKAPMIVATKGVKPRKAEDDHGHGTTTPIRMPGSRSRMRSSTSPISAMR